MNQILCLRCGAQNPPGENYCLSCGATLPKLAYTMEMASVDQVDERYRKFAEAAEMVKTGQWSVEEYANFMETTYQKLRQIEDGIREVPISEEIMDDFEEELEIGFQGVEMFNEGMETMMEYIEDEDPAHLEEGLKLIAKGNGMIHRARIINRERDKRLGMNADLYRQYESMEL